MISLPTNAQVEKVQVQDCANVCVVDFVQEDNIFYFRSGELQTCSFHLINDTSICLFDIMIMQYMVIFRMAAAVLE